MDILSNVILLYINFVIDLVPDFLVKHWLKLFLFFISITEKYLDLSRI